MRKKSSIIGFATGAATAAAAHLGQNIYTSKAVLNKSRKGYLTSFVEGVTATPRRSKVRAGLDGLESSILSPEYGALKNKFNDIGKKFSGENQLTKRE